MINNYLNIDWLKTHCQYIHYFGLGFIQLKLNQHERIHFYTDTFGITQQDEVHNHRYNFTSCILKGTLKQTIFEMDTNDTHIKSIESCNKIVVLPKNEIYCGLNKVVDLIHKTNAIYYIHHDTYHTVESTNAITYIKRSRYMKNFAEIIRNKDLELVCPFSIDVPKNKLFDYIESVLK